VVFSRSAIRSTPSAYTVVAPGTRWAIPSRAVTRYGRVPLYQSVCTSSASGPSTAIRRSRSATSGSAPPTFFSSTTVRAAARRASVWCRGQFTTSAEISAYGLGCSGSNSPSRNLTVRIRRAAASTSDSVIRPAASAAVSRSRVMVGSWPISVKLSRPARSAAALLTTWSG
jgi:hypothetical protein